MSRLLWELSGATGTVLCPQNKTGVTRDTWTTMSHVPAENMCVFGAVGGGRERGALQGTEHPQLPPGSLEPSWSYGWGRRGSFEAAGSRGLL